MSVYMPIWSSIWHLSQVEIVPYKPSSSQVLIVAHLALPIAAARPCDLMDKWLRRQG